MPLLIATRNRDRQHRSKPAEPRQAEHDLAVLALVQKVTAAKELQNINDRIVRTRMSIEGAKKVVGHITGLPSEMLVQGREPQFRYEIIRKGSDGELHTTPATEMSKLQPGDVVRISAQAQTGWPRPGGSCRVVLWSCFSELECVADQGLKQPVDVLVRRRAKLFYR